MHLTASDFMSALPIYVPQESTLACVIDKIQEFGLNKITISDSNFVVIASISKMEIAKFLLERNVRKDDPETAKILIKELLNNSQDPVVAFPTTKISEIYDAMEVLNIDYIPIVKSPWNRVLMGFVSFKKIHKALSKEKELDVV